MMQRKLLAAMTAGLLGLTSMGVRAAGHLGDPAPALKIAKWVKGKKVDLKSGKGKTIYVVEFWATWCPPCRESIPHLTSLQKKHAKDGVVVIGISDEDAETVLPFVKSAGDQMNYTVAIDDAQQTGAAYMGAYGIDTIPFAFIVDKQGRIAWLGHPLELDEVLGQVVAGTYDIEAAKRVQQAQALSDKYFELVAGSATPKGHESIGQQVYSLGKSSPRFMAQFAWTILASEELQKRDVALALKCAKVAHDADAKDFVAGHIYARALFENGQQAEAVKVQKKALQLCDSERLRPLLQKALDRYQKEHSDG